MYHKLIGITYHLENNKMLRAIKESFLMMVPVLLLGAVALVITSFPVPAFQEVLNQLWNGALALVLNGIYKATYGLLAIYLAVSISYNYSGYFYQKNNYLRILVMILSVICLAASLGFGRSGFTIESFGTIGVFTAMVVTLLVTRLFFLLYEWCYHIEFHRNARENEVDYRHMSTLMVPFTILVALFFLINSLLYTMTGVISLNELFAKIFGLVFEKMGNNIGSGLLLLFVESMLWFVGIHGGNTLEQVAQNIFVPANTDPAKIISKTFIDTFSLMGGCGATICLVIAILVVAKNKKYRNLAKVSVSTVFFNVNETLVFGLPIVLNPILLFPFVVTPLMSLVIAYAATLSGFMPVCTNAVPWTTPVLLSAYVATGSIRGSLIQLVCILLGVSIYAPFVKTLEQVSKEQDLLYVERMEQDYKDMLSNDEIIPFISRTNAIGMVAASMAEKLRDDIESHNITLYYQPQMTRNGEVFGAEALLRFSFQDRQIFPPLVIQLAKEEGLLYNLSLEIVEQACRDTKEMMGEIGEGIVISVNITAEELNDTKFIHEVIELVRQYDLIERICLEVTEETAMDTFLHIKDNISLLHDSNIGLAMDDFSMGHTSLKYLQENHFSHVKLDGVLVNQMLDNTRSREIIASIIALGNSLGFQVVAEYVDSKEKQEELVSLGCSCLQGYLFSQAITKEKFVEFYKDK